MGKLKEKMQTQLLKTVSDLVGDKTHMQEKDTFLILSAS